MLWDVGRELAVSDVSFGGYVVVYNVSMYLCEATNCVERRIKNISIL